MNPEKHQEIQKEINRVRSAIAKVEAAIVKGDMSDDELEEHLNAFKDTLTEEGESEPAPAVQPQAAAPSESEEEKKNKLTPPPPQDKTRSGAPLGAEVDPQSKSKPS